LVIQHARSNTKNLSTELHAANHVLVFPNHTLQLALLTHSGSAASAAAAALAPFRFAA
jgi:hypothetical protein